MATKQPPARKLNLAARTLVQQRIIAGDSNPQIREALRKANHPCDLADAAFSHYRRQPEIKAALASRLEESGQLAFAQFSGRVEALNTELHRVTKRLASPRLTTTQYVALVDKLKSLIALMEKLVNPQSQNIKLQHDLNMEVTGANGGPIENNYTFEYGQMVDLVVEAISNVKRAARSDGGGPETGRGDSVVERG